MQKPEICVNFNGVWIEEHEIKRPKYFSVKDWIYWWETVDSFDMEEFVKAREEVKKLRHDVYELQITIDDLKEQLRQKT